MFYLFLIVLTTASVEYFYFSQKLEAQRRQILTLTTQNNKLKSKINKRISNSSALNLKHYEPPYRYGYSMENTSIMLSPLEDSPVVYKCIKPIRLDVLYYLEIQGEKWYEVAITINTDFLKGYLKENNIKFIVEESS